MFIIHVSAAVVLGGETTPRAEQIDAKALSIIYSGSETLQYAVYWSGGVKIGDISMDIHPVKLKNDTYKISAKVKACGPLKVFYPIDDVFRSYVSGPMKLPYRYEVSQKEGYTKETKRLTQYDQSTFTVSHQTNGGEPQEFVLEGTVYNEFASFIISRALKFQEGEPAIVPTFADSKRNEVRVEFVQQERRKTLFGEKDTLKIQPKMNFKGLYEKSGNTVIWFTDDRCRVPVEVHSRIVVGSLVAQLVGYTNAACKELEPHPVPSPK